MSTYNPALDDTPTLTTEGGNIIEGYFSVFSEPDGRGGWTTPPDKVGDRVRKGSFARDLEEARRTGKRWPVCIDHEWKLSPDGGVVGFIEPWDLKEDDYGLWGRAQLFVEDSKAARFVMTLAKNLKTLGASFAYEVRRQRREKDGSTSLLDLSLIELTVTAFGCNPLAEVAVGKGSFVIDMPFGERAIMEREYLVKMREAATNRAWDVRDYDRFGSAAQKRDAAKELLAETVEVYTPTCPACGKKTALLRKTPANFGYLYGVCSDHGDREVVFLDDEDADGLTQDQIDRELSRIVKALDATSETDAGARQGGSATAAVEPNYAGPTHCRSCGSFMSPATDHPVLSGVTYSMCSRCGATYFEGKSLDRYSNADLHRGLRTAPAPAPARTARKRQPVLGTAEYDDAMKRIDRTRIRGYVPVRKRAQATENLAVRAEVDELLRDATQLAGAKAVEKAERKVAKESKVRRDVADLIESIEDLGITV